MSAEWERFNDRVDDVGWTDISDPEAFNYAVHCAMQALRDLLRSEHGGDES